MAKPHPRCLPVLTLIAACLLCFALSTSLPLRAGDAPAKVTLALLGTTDLHGNIEPFDYYANRPANRGLAKIATLIRRVRAEQSNVLLLDSGDTIQGKIGRASCRERV